MSLKSWKEEFYPVEAEQVPEQDAVAHSIRKWEGLRAENLTRHSLFRNGYRISECDDSDVVVDEFSVTWRNCALCSHYNVDEVEQCARCPLFLIRGGVKCDDDILYQGAEVIEAHPYGCFAAGDPEPMIRWLKAAGQLVQIKNAVIEANEK